MASLEAMLIMAVGVMAGGLLLFVAALSCGGLCYLISLSVGSPYM